MKFIRRLLVTSGTLLTALILWGCGTLSLIPSTVPPLMDELFEGTTPHIKVKGLKITTQGVVDSRMHYIKAMLPALEITYGLGRERSEKIATGIMIAMSAVGVGSAGALPFALKKVPQGYVKKKEEEEEKTDGNV